MDQQRREVADQVAALAADKWFGVTYREDKPTVVAAIAQKTQDGLYPEDLWN